AHGPDDGPRGSRSVAQGAGRAPRTADRKRPAGPGLRGALDSEHPRDRRSRSARGYGGLSDRGLEGSTPRLYAARRRRHLARVSAGRNLDAAFSVSERGNPAYALRRRTERAPRRLGPLPGTLERVALLALLPAPLPFRFPDAAALGAALSCQRLARASRRPARDDRHRAGCERRTCPMAGGRNRLRQPPGPPRQRQALHLATRL